MKGNHYFLYAASVRQHTSSNGFQLGMPELELDLDTFVGGPGGGGGGSGGMGTSSGANEEEDKSSTGSEGADPSRVQLQQEGGTTNQKCDTCCIVMVDVDDNGTADKGLLKKQSNSGVNTKKVVVQISPDPTGTNSCEYFQELIV